MAAHNQVDYRVLVHHEDGSYWAEVVELPGCFVAGDSMDEIWEALPEAIGLYLSTGDDSVEVEIKHKATAEEVETVDARVLVC